MRNADPYLRKRITHELFFMKVEPDDIWGHTRSLFSLL